MSATRRFRGFGMRWLEQQEAHGPRPELDLIGTHGEDLDGVRGSFGNLRDLRWSRALAGGEEDPPQCGASDEQDGRRRGETPAPWDRHAPAWPPDATLE